MYILYGLVPTLPSPLRGLSGRGVSASTMEIRGPERYVGAVSPVTGKDFVDFFRFVFQFHVQ